MTAAPRSTTATRMARAGRGSARLAVAVLALLVAAPLPAPGATKPRPKAARPAARSTTPPTIATQVAAARRVSQAVGVHVVALESGATVFAHEAEELRVVASNTKLFTTAAALDALGPAYLHETRLLLRGEVSSGLLDGDLAVIGSGDPNLSGRHHQGDSYAAFRPWAHALRARGITGVRGKLYLVDGLFDSNRVHPDWPRDQLSEWYEAPVGALSFSDNCVLVRVGPGARAGARARVEVEPELPIFSVRNVAVTTDSRRRHTVAIARAPDRNELRVSGSVWRRAKPLEAWVAVADPAEYFGAALRDALEQEGVNVLGVAETVRHLPPGGWEIAAVHRTDLQTSLEVTNKRSQNFYAESLFKLLGAVLCGDGSWSGGTRAVGQFLDRVGLGVGSYRIADGSGMSRNNRFSARQITRLLEFMFRHPWGREFVLSLAYSGEDNGRWDRRLATPPYLGNVFAKTGTLNGVSSLSGYAKGRSGKVYAFSILCNGTKGAWHAQRSQDAIVRAIIDHG